MYYVIVQHRVADYGRWRPLFEEHESVRRRHGLTEPKVFRGVDDPNDIVLRFRVEDPEQVHDFFASEELAERLEQAGVIGMPEVYFVETLP